MRTTATRHGRLQANPRISFVFTALVGVAAASGLVACGDPSVDERAAGGGAGVGASAAEQGLSPRQLLGKRLFEDTALSEPAGQSCASCHDPEHAFAGNNGSTISAVALGSRADQHGNRNVPTAMYASFSPAFDVVAELAPAADDKGSDGGSDKGSDKGSAEHGAVTTFTPTGGQFWDGRASSLVDQAKGPFLNPREMNNPDANSVLSKIRKRSYADLFRSVYGDDWSNDPEAAFDHVADAIAAFEETARFHPFSSKFDDSLRGEAQLDPLEARGFALFQDPEKGNCSSCHVGVPGSRDPHDWLFTDFTFDNLGIPRNVEIPDNDDPSNFDLGLCAQEGLASRAPHGFDVAGVCGAFKVPTLRNIAVTAPYGHNGYFGELRDVVRFYATRDTNPELWYPLGPDGTPQKFNDLPAEYAVNVNTEEVPYDRHPGDAPRLSDAEIDAIVAFLGTLSDR